MNDFRQVIRRIFRQERYLIIYLVDGFQNSNTHLGWIISIKIPTHTIDINLGMRLDIQEQSIVWIPQCQDILFLITEHRNSDTMNIITKIAMNILIRISGLHHVNSSHQTCSLVNRITICYDILDRRTEFDISTLFQPTSNTSII